MRNSLWLRRMRLSRVLLGRLGALARRRVDHEHEALLRRWQLCDVVLRMRSPNVLLH